MFDDTSLIRMVIDLISEKFHWSYEDSMDKFYNSIVCKNISNEKTGYFTCAPREIVELFEAEIVLKGL